MKDANCQWLSSTEQNQAGGCTKSFPHTDFPGSLKEKVIKKGVLIPGKGPTDRLQDFCEFPERMYKLYSCIFLG